MLNSVLTSLSVITSFHDKNKSVLEAFLPIVEYGIATLENSNEAGHCDVQSLQDKIYESTKIKINRLSLVSMLKRFSKNNVIELMQDNKYYRILNKARATQTKFSEAVRSHSREITKFVQKYAKFANDTRSVDEIIEWIYDFINLYRTKIFIDNGDLQINRNAKDSQYLSFVRFLNEINENDDNLTKTFIDIYFGYNLCSILNTNQEIKATRLNELSLFVDSNFVLRLMDLQEEQCTVETTELYEILKSNRTRLRIFKETIDEIRKVIIYNFDKYKDGQEKYIAMFNEPAYIDGVLGAFFRRKLTFTQIDEIIDNLEKTIDNYGFEVEYLSRFKIQPKEDNVLALYKLKYDNSDEDIAEYRLKKCENYISIIEVIDYLREKNNCRASCLGNCHCAFLTCDRKLYNYHKNFLQDGKYPSIITQEYLANDLLLFAPQEFGEISIKLIVSLYKESEYLNVHIIDDLGKKMLEISKENPSISDYVVRATRNTKNFTKINEIYNNKEDNDKTELILMAEKERDNENIEKEKHQKEIKSLSENLEDQSTKIIEQEERIKFRDSQIVYLNIELSESKEEVKKQNIKYYKEDLTKWYKKHKTISVVSIIVMGLLFGASGTLLFFKEILPCWAKILFAVISGVGTTVSILSASLKSEKFGLEKAFKKVSKKYLTKYSLNSKDVDEINKEIKNNN